MHTPVRKAAVVLTLCRWLTACGDRGTEQEQSSSSETESARHRLTDRMRLQLPVTLLA